MEKRDVKRSREQQKTSSMHVCMHVKSVQQKKKQARDKKRAIYMETLMYINSTEGDETIDYAFHDTGGILSVGPATTPHRLEYGNKSTESRL